MTEKRLIVDEDYNLVDTVTGEWLDDTQVFDLANKLAEENEQSKMMIATLRNIVLENENLEKENKELQQKNKKWIKYVHQLEIALKKKGDVE